MLTGVISQVRTTTSGQCWAICSAVVDLGTTSSQWTKQLSTLCDVDLMSLCYLGVYMSCIHQGETQVSFRCDINAISTMVGWVAYKTIQPTMFDIALIPRVTSTSVHVSAPVDTYICRRSAYHGASIFGLIRIWKML